MIGIHASSLPLPRQQIVSLSQSSCVSPVQLTDGRGGGRGAEIIRPQESLVLYSINHNARQKLIYCLLTDPLIFRYHLPLNPISRSMKFNGNPRKWGPIMARYEMGSLSRIRNEPLRWTKMLKFSDTFKKPMNSLGGKKFSTRLFPCGLCSRRILSEKFIIEI